MQCPSCHLENLPGAARCPRCSGILQVHVGAISLCPPRATLAARRFRRVSPRWLHGAGASRYFTLQWSFPWLLLPGGVQWRHSQWSAGTAFLGSYLLWTLLAVLLVGTQCGAIALGGAIVVHAISANHGAWRNAEGTWHAPWIAVGLILVVYGALYVVGSRYLQVRRVVEAAYPLAPGDILLVRPYRNVSARAGDVVLYEIAPAMTRSTEHWPRDLVNIAGERVDRVLAISGDRVQFRDEGLFVNGQRSRVQPLAGGVAYRSPEVVVAPAMCLVLPSTDSHFADMLADRVIEQVWMVPCAKIMGRVATRLDHTWRLRFDVENASTGHGD